MWNAARVTWADLCARPATSSRQPDVVHGLRPAALAYPILGFGIFQLRGASEQKSRTVVILGDENLPKWPPLLNAYKNGFEPSLFSIPREVNLDPEVRVEDPRTWTGGDRGPSARGFEAAWPTSSSSSLRT